MLKDTGEIGVGKYFGEKAIEENEPRAASAYVKSDKCILASLTRTSFISAVGDAFKLIRDEEITLMRKFHIFSSFSKRKLVHLYYYLEERNFTQKSKIYN